MPGFVHLRVHSLILLLRWRIDRRRSRRRGGRARAGRARAHRHERPVRRRPVLERGPRARRQADLRHRAAAHRLRPRDAPRARPKRLDQPLPDRVRGPARRREDEAAGDLRPRRRSARGAHRALGERRRRDARTAARGVRGSSVRRARRSLGTGGYRSLRRPCRARRRARHRDRRDERCALCAPGGATAPRRPALHRPRVHGRRGGEAARCERRALAEERGCPPRAARPPPRGVRERARDRRALRSRSRLRLPAAPRVSGAGRVHAVLVPLRALPGRRAREVRWDDPRGVQAARARARRDPPLRARGILPHQLGHRAVLQRAADPGAGTRLGGGLDRRVRPRYHEGRSDRA